MTGVTNMAVSASNLGLEAVKGFTRKHVGSQGKAVVVSVVAVETSFTYARGSFGILRGRSRLQRSRTDGYQEKGQDKDGKAE